MKQMIISQIKLQKCNVDQRHFNIFYNFQIPEFSAIQKFPLVVKENKQHSYDVIYGFELFKFYRENNTQDFAAYIIPEDITFEDTLCIIAEYHRQQRELYPIEIARIAELLQKQKYSNKEIAETISKRLGVAHIEKLVGQYLSIVNYHPNIVKFFIGKNAPLKIWLILAGVNPETQLFFVELIEKMRPSLKIFKEIVVNLRETEKRGDVKIEDLISELKLRDFLHKDGNLRKLLPQIRQTIFRKRYPKIFNHNEKIAKALSAIKTPRHLTIQLDNSYESKSVKMNIILNSAEDIGETQNFFWGNELQKIKDLIEKL